MLVLKAASKSGDLKKLDVLTRRLTQWTSEEKEECSSTTLFGQIKNTLINPEEPFTLERPANYQQCKLGRLRRESQ